MTQKDIFNRKINQLLVYMRYVNYTTLPYDYFFTSEKTEGGIVKTIDLYEKYKALGESILHSNGIILKRTKKELIVERS